VSFHERAAGEDISFCFFSSLLLLAVCSAKTRSPTPPYDGGSRALPATPTSQLTRRCGKAVKPCSPCAAIGRQ